MSRLNSKFSIFLDKLGYKQDDLLNIIDDNRVRYILSIKEKDIFKEPIFLDYTYLPQDNTFKEKLLNTHISLWNENKAPIFIVVSDNKTFVFNAKVKPQTSGKFDIKLFIGHRDLPLYRSST